MSSSGGPVTMPAPAPAPAFSGIDVDYAPESRCSDNNWSTTTPVACNPQLSFNSDCSTELSNCASSCQACYTSDLGTIKSINVGTITIYQFPDSGVP